MRVAVTWQMCGYVDVPGVDNMADAIKEIAKNGDHYKLPQDADYVDGSFEPSSYDVEEQEAICRL